LKNPVGLKHDERQKIVLRKFGLQHRRGSRTTRGHQLH